MTSIVIDGKTALYGLVGNPLGHSFSPEMQTHAFQDINLNAIYIPLLVEEKDLPSLPNSLSAIGLQGFNVTIPYKEKILPFLDELSPEAEALGSVNTVVRKKNRWIGYSTDGRGFVRSAGEEGISFKGKRVMLLGGGGAAKAVAYTIAARGISNLYLVNRTQKKILEIADKLEKTAPQVNIVTGQNLQQDVDILINCTSVGMENIDCPVPDEQIHRSGCVIDIIYNPPKTELLRKSESVGIPSFNGLGMLLYQGIEAFELWTGRTAPIQVMKQSLNRSLGKRI